MKSLELLGLQPDGKHLTLNDAEGNRYTLPITDELRAVLRRDRSPQDLATHPARQMTPREIQALVREGRTVDEVSDLSALPASRISALAYPIEAERTYTADQARSFPVGREAGAFSLEELVASRLVSRGVAEEDIHWDATRAQDEPWRLSATFDADGGSHVARWDIDLERKSVEARNDEARWLSETSLTRDDAAPWRPANTPAVANNDEDLARPASIDAVLASLDSQRGKSRPMPDEDNDVPAPDFDGAHPAFERPFLEQSSLSVAPLRALKSTDADTEAETKTHKGTDHRVDKTDGARTDEESQPSEAENAGSDGDGEESANRDAEAPQSAKPAKSGRKGRPAMPSWDDLFFGPKE